MTKKFHLIGAKTCPYTQRTLIALILKAVKFEMTYIDLADKPQWFLDIAPLARVPVLKINNHVLFESSVINEYLDETIPPRLHPEDPLPRAKNRGWIEYCSAMLGDAVQLFQAKTPEQFEHFHQQLENKMWRLENEVSGGMYFNGTDMSLVDCAFAPFFRNLLIVDHIYPLHLLEDKPNIVNWSNELLAHDAVKESVVKNYDELFITNIRKKDSIISQQM
jgi:glutathione S-transferase